MFPGFLESQWQKDESIEVPTVITLVCFLAGGGHVEMKPSHKGNDPRGSLIGKFLQPFYFFIVPLGHLLSHSIPFVSTHESAA